MRRTPYRWSPLRFILASGFLAPLATAANAATLHVPLDHATVSSAVATASSGDTILISPGVHQGGVFVNGKALVFASRYLVTGDTTLVAQTVVNGAVSGYCPGGSGCSGNSVLEFGDNAHGSAVIGLTLQNASNGVASASTVDLTRCRIVANNDGVDFVPGSGGTFRDCLFANNSDDGVDLNGRMNLTVTGCEIRDNTDDGIEYRLYAYSGPQLQVNFTNNRITGNGEDGIQFIDYAGTANVVIRVERNLFQSNYNASGQSAAIAFMPGGETIENLVGAPTNKRVYVVHNTILAEKNGVVGGGNLIALNNIFSGIQGTALRRVGGASIASYNLFWANGTNYSESVVDLAHVVVANPQLGANGRLTIASPAINAGTAHFQWLGETVLNVPPSGYADAAPDLGAFESAPNTAPSVSAGPDRTVTLGTDAIEVGSSGAALRGDVALGGAVIDDGLPYPPSTGILWTVMGGPGPVTIQNPILPLTRATFSVPGIYTLQLAANDGKLASADQVQVTVLVATNMPPVVDAGPERTITLPADAALDGTVLDDGLPSPPGALTTAWSKASGPGHVSFQSASLVDTRAAFAIPGTYVLHLAASDGALSVTDSVVLTVLPVPNTPPVVSAGPNRVVVLPADVLLDGTVTDDGLPDPPATLVTAWTVVSGPGQVTFQDTSLVDTRAAFAVPGVYVLRLTAADGELTTSDTVAVTAVNYPPAVNAGPDQSIMIPAFALLDGTVTDDGLPSPPGAVTTLWSVESGPGPVVFQNASLADTRAVFQTPGIYLLKLTASDGALSASDVVEITVEPPPPPFEAKIGSSADDSEESANGHIVRNSSDLELVYDGGNQRVGLRFTNVAVPAGAIIIQAWVQFEADGTASGATTLTLRGQGSDHAAAFTLSDNNISSRPPTTASASWTPPSWLLTGEAGAAQRTPDLAAVVQEIVDRPGWTSGNAMAFVVSGSGRRVARSYEGRAAGAALLHIEYGGLPVTAAARLAPSPLDGTPPSEEPLAPVAGAWNTSQVEFALRGVVPQPSHGALRVEFALAEAGDATIELLDVTGRRVVSRDLGTLGPGPYTFDLAERLPAGIYLVRLSQGMRAQVRKAIVLN